MLISKNGSALIEIDGLNNVRFHGQEVYEPTARVALWLLGWIMTLGAIGAALYVVALLVFSAANYPVVVIPFAVVYGCYQYWWRKNHTATEDKE